MAGHCRMSERRRGPAFRFAGGLGKLAAHGKGPFGGGGLVGEAGSPLSVAARVYSRASQHASEGAAASNACARGLLHDQAKMQDRGTSGQRGGDDQRREGIRQDHTSHDPLVRGVDGAGGNDLFKISCRADGSWSTHHPDGNRIRGPR